jgi:hypothetical protein
MNCNHTKRQLLAAAHIDRPSAEVAAHLAQCPACRSWQERLLAIERQIVQLPVPRSQGKRRVLRELFAGQATPANGNAGEWESPQKDRVACSPTQDPAASHSPTIPWPHALTLAAAALLLAVCGWWLFTGSPNPHSARAARPAPPPPDPLLAGLSEGHLRLSQARSPRERVEELARFVDHLHDRTQTLAPIADAATMQKIARLYERVLSDGVMRGAQTLARDQRQAVLSPLAERLARVGDEAEHWAHGAQPGSGEPLRHIAAVVRTGTQRIRALLEEGTP